jgi:hypothetical protein
MLDKDIRRGRCQRFVAFSAGCIFGLTSRRSSFLFLFLLHLAKGFQRIGLFGPKLYMLYSGSHTNGVLQFAIFIVVHRITRLTSRDTRITYFLKSPRSA